MKTSALWPVILAASLFGACVETVEVESLPAHVAFVGPSTQTTRGVLTWFAVESESSSLARVTFEVCAGQTCYTPDLQRGSTNLDSVPTSMGEELLAVPVYWNPKCNNTPASVPFEVQVSVQGSDLPALRSPAVSLMTLAGDGEPFCP